MSSARDVLVFTAVIATLAIAAYLFHFAYSEFEYGMLNNSVVNASDATKNILTGHETNVNRLDYFVFSIFMIFALLFIITGWLVAGEPVLVFIYFIVIVIGTVLAAVFNNVWVRIVESAVLTKYNTIAAFPITDAILSNFPVYVAVIGFIGLIIVLAKPMIYGGGGVQR